MYTKESFQKKIDEKYPQEKLEVTLFNGAGRQGVIKCLQCGEIYSLQNARNFIINGKKIVCKNCQGTKAVVKEVKHKIKIPKINVVFFIVICLILLIL